jgi:hypothetical protein
VLMQTRRASCQEGSISRLMTAQTSMQPDFQRPGSCLLVPVSFTTSFRVSRFMITTTTQHLLSALHGLTQAYESLPYLPLRSRDLDWHRQQVNSDSFLQLPREPWMRERGKVRAIQNDIMHKSDRRQRSRKLDERTRSLLAKPRKLTTLNAARHIALRGFAPDAKSHHIR